MKLYIRSIYRNNFNAFQARFEETGWVWHKDFEYRMLMTHYEFGLFNKYGIK
jgi:hypothetical protein